MNAMNALTAAALMISVISPRAYAAAAFAGASEAASGIARKAKAAGTVRLKMDPACVLQAMIYKINLTAFPEGLTYIRFDPKKPVPRIRYASETPLAEFQDAIEKQWGERPESVSNAYVPGASGDTIFLLDESAYYLKMKRRIEDSLAHEFVHFLQHRYQNMSMAEIGEWGETDAVMNQSWFRETYFGAAPPAGAPACLQAR